MTKVFCDIADINVIKKFDKKSIVKGFTDRLMKLNNTNVLNLRIRMPINDTYNPRNFITKITNYEKVCSISNSMTVLPDLLTI